MGVVDWLIEPMTDNDCATNLTNHFRVITTPIDPVDALTWFVCLQWVGIVGNALMDMLKVPLNTLDILLMQQVGNPDDCILFNVDSFRSSAII